MRRPFSLLALIIAAPAFAAQPEQFPAPEDAEQPPYGFFSGWSGSFELGLNGSTGNVERFSGRGGVRAERRTDFNETRSEFLYIFARSDGDTVQNEAHVLLRNDRLLQDSRWRYFGLGLFDYDQFKDWDVRLSAFLGVGYEFVKTDRTLLLGRAGAGLTREIGGEDNTITPEGLLGIDVEHQLTDRQRIVGSFDLFPDLSDFGEFRYIAKAAWEILVDPEVNLSLRIGVENQYDSDPAPGIKRSDIDYFAVVVWSF